MKHLKRIFSLFLALLFVSSMGTVAYATEAMPKEKCTVSVTLTDKTGSILEDIDIVFIDTENGGEYPKTITSLEYLFQIGVKIGLPKGRTYSVRFDYLSAKKGLFKITNSDGSAISTFTADSDSLSFDWIIENGAGGAVESQPQNETVGEQQTEYTAGDFDNEEAKEVFQRFLDVAAKYKDNDYFNQILAIYEADDYANYYAKYSDETADDFKAKSPLEKFVIYNTYVKPCMKMALGEWSQYFETKELFLSKCCTSYLNYLNRVDRNSTELADAFKALFEFQYDYIISSPTHDIYNFYTGQTKNEVVESTPQETLSPEEEQRQKEEKEFESRVQELESQYEDENNKEEKAGIWDGVLKELKANWFTLVLILIGCGVLVAVIVIRKKKAIDDN